MKYWRYILAFVVLGVTLYVYLSPYIVEYNELAKSGPFHTSGPRITPLRPVAGQPLMPLAEPTDFSHLSNLALFFNVLALAAACVVTWLTFGVFRKIAGGALSYPWIALMVAAIFYLTAKALWILTILRVIRLNFDLASFLELAFIGAFLVAAIVQRRSLI